MIQAIIDNKKFKILFGIFFAFPATLILLATTLHATAFTAALFRDFNFEIALLVLSYWLGLIGTIGAWTRLLKTKETTNYKLRMWIKAFLVCGIVSSLALAVMFLMAEWVEFLIIPIGLLSLGVAFLYGT